MLDLLYQPLYKKLYTDILKKINDKKYLNTNKLPSENELASAYRVNRHTIRKALGLLKKDGHIYSKKGKGSFVNNINIPYKITDKSSFSSKMLDLGYVPKTELLNVDIVEADKNISENLDIPLGFKVIELKLLRYAQDVPLQISYSYFDAFVYRNILDNLDIEPFSLYKILQMSYPDLEVRKISTIFSSFISTKEQSSTLKVEQNLPILSVQTVSIDQNSNFVEYGISHFRGDICNIKIDLTGDGDD